VTVSNFKSPQNPLHQKNANVEQRGLTMNLFLETVNIFALIVARRSGRRGNLVYNQPIQPGSPGITEKEYYMTPFWKSLRFWTLFVGLIFYVIKNYIPSFPLDEVQILGIVVFILALFGIVPELRARGVID